MLRYQIVSAKITIIPTLPATTAIMIEVVFELDELPPVDELTVDCGGRVVPGRVPVLGWVAAVDAGLAEVPGAVGLVVFGMGVMAAVVAAVTAAGFVPVVVITNAVVDTVSGPTDALLVNVVGRSALERVSGAEMVVS